MELECLDFWRQQTTFCRCLSCNGSLYEVGSGLPMCESDSKTNRQKALGPYFLCLWISITWCQYNKTAQAGRHWEVTHNGMLSYGKRWNWTVQSNFGQHDLRSTSQGAAKVAQSDTDIYFCYIVVHGSFVKTLMSNLHEAANIAQKTHWKRTEETGQGLQSENQGHVSDHRDRALIANKSEREKKKLADNFKLTYTNCLMMKGIFGETWFRISVSCR